MDGGPGHAGVASSAKDVARTVAAVRAARARADVVVVDLHWGTEQVACPTPVQTRWRARRRAGADVVVGSHAHVLLGAGLLGGAYVAYGLGNFVFYATSPAQQASGVLTLTLSGRTVTSSSWAPARISGGVPVPLTGAAATAGRLLGATARVHGPEPRALTGPAPPQRATRLAGCRGRVFGLCLMRAGWPASARRQT